LLKQALTILALGLSFAAQAQSFPTKPVRIITPFPVGSGPEGVARLVADKLSKSWGQPVTVENRPGGNTVIATLRAELAAMQKNRDEADADAQRYRWLKSDRCYWVEIQSQPSGDLIFQGRHGHAFLHHSGNAEMDDVIDSAMRKGER
jgi:hypothetical protein